MAKRKRKYTFGGPYQAPTSYAFGGTLGAPPSADTYGPPPTTAAPAGSPAAQTAGAGSLPPLPDPFGIVSGATNSANTTYGNTIGTINTGEDTLAGNYGFTLTRDPTSGAVTGYAIDPNVDVNNPFSKAALLDKSYHQQQNRTLNGYAAAGQLYSGALKNQQGADTSNYNQGVDSLTKEFGGGITGYETARTTAGTTRDTTIGNANTDNLNTILNTDPTNLSAIVAATAPAIDPATAGLKYPLAPGYELYRDPFTGELKARKKAS